MKHSASIIVLFCSFIFANFLSADPCTGGVNAGPIWNQQDAEKKCPTTCKNNNNASWNGQWNTTERGKMSVCSCTFPSHNVNAGPIWNQQDAEKKCPTTCKSDNNATWNRQWTTTEQGK